MESILLENLACTRKICVDAIKSCRHHPRMSIHSRIKERRLALGLSSHSALAALVGVSWQTVQLWEKEGGTAPNRSRLPVVAEVLGVTPEWLISGDKLPSQALTLVSNSESNVSEDSAYAITDEIIEMIILYQQSGRRAQENILDFVRSAAKGTRGHWVRAADET
jgi:transcriptional regulator with XRE-family HTH domain